MDFPVIISFYTKETFYQVEAHNFIASCQKFSLDVSIEGIDSWGSWELNCAFKPFFILKKLRELKRSILWVDIDAIFVSQPQAIDCFNQDFAVYIQEDLGFDHPSKVRSGTVFVNYTQAGLELTAQWMEESKRLILDPLRTEEFWDQIALRNVLARLSNIECSIGYLPLSYIKIFDHLHDREQEKEVVVAHYQASRRFKNLIKNGNPT